MVAAKFMESTTLHHPFTSIASYNCSQIMISLSFHDLYSSDTKGCKGLILPTGPTACLNMFTTSELTLNGDSQDLIRISLQFVTTYKYSIMLWSDYKGTCI
jgi:hypothetical protein